MLSPLLPKKGGYSVAEQDATDAGDGLLVDSGTGNDILAGNLVNVSGLV